MGVKTVPHPPYCTDLAPCDFSLFSKLTGCRYETIEEMKEAVTKVIDMLTQEDLHGAFQKFLELYKRIAARGYYVEGVKSFMCVLSIKVPIRKKVWKLIVCTSKFVCLEIVKLKELEIWERIETIKHWCYWPEYCTQIPVKEQYQVWKKITRSKIIIMIHVIPTRKQT